MLFEMIIKKVLNDLVIYCKTKAAKIIRTIAFAPCFSLFNRRTLMFCV